MERQWEVLITPKASDAVAAQKRRNGRQDLACWPRPFRHLLICCQEAKPHNSVYWASLSLSITSLFSSFWKGNFQKSIQTPLLPLMSWVPDRILVLKGFLVLLYTVLILASKVLAWPWEYASFKFYTLSRYLTCVPRISALQSCSMGRFTHTPYFSVTLGHLKHIPNYCFICSSPEPY